jgi:hypothetical protein
LIQTETTTQGTETEKDIKMSDFLYRRIEFNESSSIDESIMPAQEIEFVRTEATKY